MRFPLQALFLLTAAVAFSIVSVQHGWMVFGSTGILLYGAAALMCVSIACIAIARWRTDRIRCRLATIMLMIVPLGFMFYPQAFVGHYSLMRSMADYEHSIEAFEDELQRDQRFADIDLRYFPSFDGFDAIFVDGSVSNEADLKTLRDRLNEKYSIPGMIIIRVTVPGAAYIRYM